MSKPKHIKPGLYAMIFEQMKDIAKEYGYALLIHGSMGRDLDLVAVPWVDNPKPEEEMIKDFHEYLTGKPIGVKPDGTFHYSILPGNRHSYVIDLNRGDKHGEWVRFEDSQYYLDISVIQLTTPTKA
ncbi:hypothetical protein [Flagellimonas flava]|uniref:hypothetical protein n=1 Tax=Flagellimonas flava TaxID=570519 RepID=UPI003D65AC46